MKIRFYQPDYPNGLPTACHEAAHACYLIACANGDGKIVLRALMGSNGIPGWLGVCEYEPKYYDNLDDFLKIVSCYVGEASDKEFFGWDLTEYSTPTDEDTQDQEDAMEIVFMNSSLGESTWEILKRARDEASAFVRRYETAIRAIGAHLCRVYEMSGPEIAAMMQKYPPNPEQST
jgi:hypothetical protein